MPEELQKLKISVSIDSDTKQLKILGAEIENLGNKINTAGKNSGGLTDKNIKLNSIAKKLGTAIGENTGLYIGEAGAIVATALIIKKSIDNEEKEITRQRLLKTTLESVNISYDKNKKSIDNNLISLTKGTKYTRSEAYEAFNKAVQITGKLSTGYKLMSGEMDVAVAKNKDLSTVHEEFSLALAGNARGLIMLKREFGDVVKNAKTGQEAVNILIEKFSNARTTEHDLATETKGLKDLWEQNTAALGKDLMPAVYVAIKGFKYLVLAIQAVGRYATLMIMQVVSVVNALVGLFQGGVKKMVQNFADGQSAIGQATQDTIAGVNSDYEKLFGEIKDGQIKITNEKIEALNKELDAQKKANKEQLEEEKKQKKEMLKLAKEAAKETASIEKESAQEIKKVFIDNIQNTLSKGFDDMFSAVTTGTGPMEDRLKTAFENIEKAFGEMLAKMLSEYLAKAAMFAVLNALTGGAASGAGVGIDAISAAARGVSGAGDVPFTVPPGGGNYKLKAGEKVGGDPVHIIAAEPEAGRQ